ncbi:MAG: MarR family transcriptional regulator [Chloroflexota bacterium]|nr:MarR family transcriptional regulator [Chloroflexota bacterium]
MATLPERILTLITKTPGLTDREIADAMLGTGHAQQPVNQACHKLESAKVLARRKRTDGRIGNYPSGFAPTPAPAKGTASPAEHDAFAEDAIKRSLETYLQSKGWSTEIAWGQTHGVDIVAQRDGVRWIIEVKGRGSRPEMRVNYFIGMLGELLQRMSDPDAKYSIALPDMPQFRGLWSRLPALARSRTTITALFVDEADTVAELS